MCVLWVAEVKYVGICRPLQHSLNDAPAEGNKRLDCEVSSAIVGYVLVTTTIILVHFDIVCCEE